MDAYNRIYYLISIPFVLLFVFLFFSDLFKKSLKKKWEFYSLGMIFYYIIFSSGISFWQADRLVIFAIPLWITLYAVLINDVVKKFNKKGIF